MGATDPEAIARLERAVAWEGAEYVEVSAADLRYVLSRLKAADARLAEAERVVDVLNNGAPALSYSPGPLYNAGFAGGRTWAAELLRAAFAATPRGED